MLWKTARQRKAVMALLTKAQRRAKAVRIHPAVLSEADLNTVMSPTIVRKLIARLPAAHRKLSRMKKLEISDDLLIRGVGSWNPTGKKNLLRISRKPENYMKEVGSTSRPSHIPGGYWAHRLHSEKIMSPEAQMRHTLRNSRVGAAKVFYHEYGHSVWSGTNERFRNDIWIFGPGLREEWRIGRLPPTLDPAESFAESYAQYATSKVSRSRLRKQRPVSYNVMDSFFKHGEDYAIR